MKTLKVSQIYDGYTTDDPPKAIHKYRVETVTNSVTPNIMDHLKVAELAPYCESDEWEVTIT